MRRLLLALLLLAPTGALCDDLEQEEELLLEEEEAEQDEASGGSCRVASRRGMPAYRAEIVDETSLVKLGVLKSTAWLDGDDVRIRAGLFKPRIGEVGGDEIVFRQGWMTYRSKSVQGSTVVVKHGLEKWTYTSSGCTSRQLGLGVAHLEHLNQKRERQRQQQLQAGT